MFSPLLKKLTEPDLVLMVCLRVTSTDDKVLGL